MNEPVCKFYKRHGYCHFLNKCWYSHSSGPATKNTSLAATARELKSQCDDGLHETTSHGKKGVRRNAPLKRYVNFRPKPFRNPRHINHAAFNKDSEKSQSCEYSTDMPTSCQVSENSNLGNVNKETVGEINQTDRVLNTREHSPSAMRRRQGNRRWNVYKGPRYFYGNFGTRPKDQKTRHGSNQRQALVNSENSHKNVPHNEIEAAPRRISPEKNPKNTSNLNRPNTGFGRLQMKTCELSSEDFSRLLSTEIQQLKKRFPNHKAVEMENNNHSFTIEYFPSDPDWPFQISSLNLHLIFPQEYPKVLFSAFVLNEAHYLPELLNKHLNKSIQNWLKERQETNENNGVTELVFRPFLKWLDKNLENMFLYGLRLVKQEIDAKAAGIECIPYENLCNSLKEEDLSASSSENLESNDLINGNVKDTNQDGVLNDLTPSTSNTEGPYSNTISNISHTAEEITEDTQKLSIFDNGSTDRNKLKGGIQNMNMTGSKTEVKFKNFYLSENAATLLCVKVQLSIQCYRCKTRHDMGTLANKLNCAACTKCHEMQEVFFQSTLLHPNSSSLGHIYLAQCKIIDLPLVSCEFLIGCLNCTKQCSLTGVHYDQQRVTWCHYCNSKMAVTIQGVRFLEIHTDGMADKLQAQIVKLDSKVVKNALIAVQPGKPLPENGTCKHYKKSYRWLRFPCCGKAYPCDLCHDEKEDHEMKLASRMICGFCAKEQPYSKDKECIGCGSYTTKKSCAHWEGGKGCRDKSKMSRGDKHKYGGVSKTKSVKKVGSNIKKDSAQ